LKARACNQAAWLAVPGCRKTSAQLFVGLELAAGTDGAELDVLDSLPEEAFVSDLTSDFASAFVSGFFSAAAPSPLDELPFEA